MTAEVTRRRRPRARRAPRGSRRSRASSSCGDRRGSAASCRRPSSRTRRRPARASRESTVAAVVGSFVSCHGLLDDLSWCDVRSRARCPGRAAGSPPPQPGRPRPAVRHPSSPVAQHSLRTHRGQTLVLQPHRRPARSARRAGARTRGSSPPPGPRPRTASAAARPRPRPPRVLRATSRAIRARSPLPRRTVSTGVARNPVGSLRATPIRASPGSTPRRTPSLTRSALPGGLGRHRRPRTGGQRLVDPRGVGAAALGDVVLAAAAAADQRHHRPDQVVGLDARARGRRRWSRPRPRPCRP